MIIHTVTYTFVKHHISLVLPFIMYVLGKAGLLHGNNGYNPLVEPKVDIPVWLY